MNPSALPGFPPVVTWLQRHNIFYLLSALLMLLGCFLISGPYLFTLRRDLGGLLILLGTINVYEGLVMLACGFVCRQAPRGSEGPTLLLVAQLFLLDVTFTINACLPISLGLGVAVAAASFVLALLKIYALERGIGRPIFERMRAFQIAAILFLYSFQGLLGLYPEGDVARTTAAAFAVWTLFGLLPLLLLGLPEAAADAPGLPGLARSEAAPWWQRDAFARVSSLLTFGMLGAQVIAQSWVYRTPFAWSWLAPGLVVAAAVAPRLTRVPDRIALNLARLWIVVALLLMLGWLGGGPYWRPGWDGWRVTLTPYRITCFVAACSYLLLRLRERDRTFADLACGCFWLGVASFDLASLLRLLDGRAGPVAAGAAVLAGAAWLAMRVTFPRALAFWLLSLVLVTRMLHVECAGCDRLLETLRWGPLGALALCLIFGRGTAWARAALLAAVWGWGVWSCMPDDVPSLVYFYAAAAVLLAAVSRNRALFPLVLAYVAAANAKAYGVEATTYAAAWGWFAILLAFAFLGLAFQITRARLRDAAAPEGPPA
ncbi:MAG: hypothetical protein KIS92_06045 [Planctomycetota bacterium]|nr:hypothetical protein [Planctomycetota bacterium]